MITVEGQPFIQERQCERCNRWFVLQAGRAYLDGACLACYQELLAGFTEAREWLDGMRPGQSWEDIVSIYEHANPHTESQHRECEVFAVAVRVLDLLYGLEEIDDDLCPEHIIHWAGYAVLVS